MRLPIVDRPTPSTRTPLPLGPYIIHWEEPAMNKAQEELDQFQGDAPQKPPRKRFKLNKPRASIACSNCRARKVRCSGIPAASSPTRACSFCSDRNLDCSLKDMTLPDETPAQIAPDLLPPSDVLLAVFDVFCARFQSCGLLNFLHPVTFRHAISTASSDHKELLLAILCLSLRFCDLPDMEEDTAYANEALRLVQSKPELYSLKRMQALLMLAFYDCIENNESRGYFNLGSAIRIGQILQLETNELRLNSGRSNKPESDLPPVVVEERRRTFWCAFLLERLLCDGIHRTCAIRFDPFNITIPMPAPEADWIAQRAVPTARFHEEVDSHLPTYLLIGQPEPPTDIYGYTLRIADLWASVVTYVALSGKHTLRLPPWHSDSMFAKLDKSLADWLRGLPLYLRLEQNNIEAHHHSRQVELYGLMHCLYFASLCYLHRDFIPFCPTDWTPARGPIDEGKGAPTFDRSHEPPNWFQLSAETAFRAADSVTNIIEQIPTMTNCPFAGFFLLTSSTLHCIGFWFPSAAPPLYSAEMYLQKDVRLLLDFAQSWGIAQAFCSNLSQLYSLYGSTRDPKGTAQNKEARDQTRAGVLSLLANHRAPSDGQKKTPRHEHSKHNLFQLLNAAKLSSPASSLSTPSPPVPMASLPYTAPPDLQLADQLFGLNAPMFANGFDTGLDATPIDWSHFGFSANNNAWLYSYPIAS